MTVVIGIDGISPEIQANGCSFGQCCSRLDKTEKTATQGRWDEVLGPLEGKV